MSLAKIPLFLIALSLFTLLLAADKGEKKMPSQIVKAMEKMKKPGKELENLARNKLFKDKNFAKNATIIAQEAKSISSVKHSDKKFNDLNSEMVQYSAKLVEAIKKDNFDEIKKSYEDLRGVCVDCHEAFKD